jgi:hydrogenase nickel incorporation protein HypB
VSVHNVKIVQNLLAANDQVAARNQRRFDDAGVLAVNVIASPGAGKTSLIIKTMEALKNRARVGVIEGDIAGSIDTEKVLAAGAADAVQINTGGNCHLEANMVDQALNDLDLAHLDLVIIENVGNLICPTHWVLGEHLKLCLLSAAEGHDKPIKYPEIFAASDVIVLNKIDLIELVDFERDFFYQSVRALNQQAPIYEVSCRNGAGMTEFAEWLLQQHQQLEKQTDPHEREVTT